MNYSKIWKGYRAGDGPRFHASWDGFEHSGPGPRFPGGIRRARTRRKTRYLVQHSGPGPRF